MQYRAPKDLLDALKRMNLLVAAILHDIETYTHNPHAFSPAEYFEDVVEAANETQQLVVWMRSQMLGVNNIPKEP